MSSRLAGKAKRNYVKYSNGVSRSQAVYDEFFYGAPASSPAPQAKPASLADGGNDSSDESSSDSSEDEEEEGECRVEREDKRKDEYDRKEKGDRAKVIRNLNVEVLFLFCDLANGHKPEFSSW